MQPAPPEGPRRLLAVVERVVFFATIVLFSVLLGFLISQNKVFPYKFLLDSKLLFEDAVIWAKLMVRGERRRR